jgi:hypothetical protein
MERYAEDVIIAPGSVLQEELQNKAFKLQTQAWIEEQFGKDVLPGLKFYVFENSTVALLRNYIQKVIRKTIREKLILKKINLFLASNDKNILKLLKDVQLTPATIRKCEREIDDFFYKYIHSFVGELEEQQ